MVFVPELRNYSIEKLVALGNSSDDAFAREDIKKFNSRKGIVIKYANVLFIK